MKPRPATGWRHGVGRMARYARTAALGDDVTKLTGKKHRPGVYQCNACREQFTVTVKTVFERSKIPLSKWLAALFLLTASKKGVLAHQVHRSLGITYKSAWFMMHCLREAMRSGVCCRRLVERARRSKSMKRSWAVRKVHQSRRAKGTAISGAILFLSC